jgi:hypothetical protein
MYTNIKVSVVVNKEKKRKESWERVRCRNRLPKQKRGGVSTHPDIMRLQRRAAWNDVVLEFWHRRLFHKWNEEGKRGKGKKERGGGNKPACGLLEEEERKDLERNAFP